MGKTKSLLQRRKAANKCGRNHKIRKSPFSNHNNNLFRQNSPMGANPPRKF